ncbi:MAG: hypothetical protein LBQ14_01995 [Treponema sp.]|jgi:hypothetical protein|nr:hypothetical protein [Treponema sp.]
MCGGGFPARGPYIHHHRSCGASFTRGIALEAYTENAEDSGTGLLRIKDRSLWQSPANYRRRQSDGCPKVKTLTFAGGGVAGETLKQIEK